MLWGMKAASNARKCLSCLEDSGLSKVQAVPAERHSVGEAYRVPLLVLDPARESLVSSSGGVLLRQTIELCGLGRSLSAALSPWRSPRSAHDPGKVLLDVATAVALGGDCLADVAVIRAQPEVFGPVASDPTVSRLVGTLAGDVDAALAAIRSARAEA